MTNLVAHCKRLERLTTLRAVHEQVWVDCYDHSFPIRGSGLQGGWPMDAQQAADRKARLLHSVSTDAGRTLAAALVSGAVPSSSVWALLGVSNADDGGKRWLDEKGKQLHEEVHSGTFDAVAMECALDMVAAGWFALYIDVDRDFGGFSFEQWPISSVFAAASKPGGLVDTVYRKYTLTVEQAAVEFGEDALHENTRAKLQDMPDAEVEMVHAIFPRYPHVKGARLAKNMPIASLHFELATKHLLREGGYHEMPVIVPRWAVIPNSVYAIGPMFDALPDARQLNELIRMDMMNADIAIGGMWVGVDDGVLTPRTAKLGARKMLVGKSIEIIKKLSSGGDWMLADTRIAQLTAAIRRTLMADQLEPQDGPTRTATEINVRVGMIRQLLGPIYGRLQAEWLAPMVQRCFGLMYRAGLFGEAPQSLGGASLQVRYNNPLARAQKLEDVAAIESFNASMAQMVDMGQVVPEADRAADVVNYEEQARVLADGLGVPLKTMRDADQLAAFRQRKLEAQQAAQQQAQQQEMQGIAAQGAVDRAVKAA